ncbi:glycoside hydrolase family 9 protein [Fulvivirga sp. 29W222]|uniref:Glycoside hydrolase family 9 protein n=1 Tax=Fulvivirga marina TaxID=2494733 RepID=A0A937G3U8_9BACT|nr:glycoside hydrolase family 9 protein [Fulvivirga marina]MBL6447941.1 glycoside hydrolase family 9 protein [Fulvivirga marina]
MMISLFRSTLSKCNQVAWHLLFLMAGLPGIAESQTVSKYIVVDQFGYRPSSEKIAVIRNPITGFDAAESFSPGDNYALVNASDNSKVFSATPEIWNGGKEDASSGDQAWWFDFSTYDTPGNYYVLDVDNNVRSYEFTIDEHVYAEVLKHAVRTFFYQRAGYNKPAQYAGSNWADNASHLGTLQDAFCRRYDDKSNASTERDLRGGWYDAGDYNKYTPWTANYIVGMLNAYESNPDIWGDNYCLPYSGNGTPDLIDEIKWGLDHLLRLQDSDGSLISIVSLAGGSPPSSATGQSLYGGVNTTSALAGAAAYAYAARIFSDLGMGSYSSTLLESAKKAWNWADANPNVIWKNNSSEYNSVGIGAGQQETDDYGRFAYKMRAAIHLYQTTGDSKYKTFIESNYQDIHLMQWNYAFPFEEENQQMLLHYASLQGVSSEVASSIKDTYKAAMEGTDNFSAFYSEVDPYTAHLATYVWGSNHIKARKGLMFMDYITYTDGSTKYDDAAKAAERYLHYIHGVNPLSFCYLSNMYAYGADNGVNEFYHTWFGDGTDWDRVGTDPYGPAPGYLVGGANPSYDWDSCCPSGCGGASCDAAQRSRIVGQPSQKAYDDFNTSWPMNSWSVTENSCGYQVGYIQLLSKFVSTSEQSGCEINVTTGAQAPKNYEDIAIYPNPSSGTLIIGHKGSSVVKVYNMQGELVIDQKAMAEEQIDIRTLPDGIYQICLFKNGQIIYRDKVVKR